MRINVRVVVCGISGRGGRLRGDPAHPAGPPGRGRAPLPEEEDAAAPALQQQEEHAGEAQVTQWRSGGRGAGGVEFWVLFVFCFFSKSGLISGFQAARCACLDPSMSWKSLFERERKKKTSNLHLKSRLIKTVWVFAPSVMIDKANRAGHPQSSQFDSDVENLLKLICMNNFLELFNKPCYSFFFNYFFNPKMLRS